MTTYETMSLLIQLSAVLLTTFTLVVTLIIFFVKKK
ncbi:MAG TPA: putative holin-like toxin [Sporosarcina psychrophila]|uniref:Holin-like toxin n=1 Tax=Sporosarcina psychrophila TaxID=1476 RepID=A0A921KDQ6_SPOPS|nr:putative holin-like toxin [Sporosarcina psychrophila]